MLYQVQEIIAFACREGMYFHLSFKGKTMVKFVKENVFALLFLICTLAALGGWAYEKQCASQLNAAKNRHIAELEEKITAKEGSADALIKRVKEQMRAIKLAQDELEHVLRIYENKE